MADLLARVTLPHRSGFARDAVVNDFAFTGISDSANATADVISFYNDAVAPDNFPLASFLSYSLSRNANAAHVDVYDIDTPAKLGGAIKGQPDTYLGSPIRSESFTLGAASGGDSAMPSEVAMCLSFTADLVGVIENAGGTRPRARRRGRIYFGPLISGVGEADANGARRPKGAGAFGADLLNAGIRLRDSATTEWGVWSRRDAIIRPVVHVSYDNAFDTQRRRGERASLRTGV